jgi:hypothetical protein
MAVESMIRNEVTSHVAEVSHGESRLSVRSSARELSLTQVAMVCAEETQKHRRGEPFDGECCFELFRRAICNRDDQAWEKLIEQYRGIVVFWVRRHPSAKTLGEDDDYWVDGAFVRFYQAISPERFSQFSAIPQILRYLKLCVDSSIQDAVRSFSQQPVTVPIDGADDPWDDGNQPPIATISSADSADQSTNTRELWAAIEGVLRNDVERRVAYLTFVLEYKPREIQALYPNQFTSTSTVYPVIRNVVDRLQRSPEIREFLQ